MNHVKFRVFTRRETFTFRLTNISSIIRLLFLDVPQFLKNVALFFPGLNGPRQRPELARGSVAPPGYKFWFSSPFTQLKQKNIAEPSELILINHENNDTEM